MDLNFKSSYNDIGNSLMITLNEIDLKGETPFLKSQMLYKFARIKFLEKKYEESYKLLGESNSITIMDNLPENKEIYYWTGRVLEAQGKKEIANENYKKVLSRARFLKDQEFVDEILDRIYLLEMEITHFKNLPVISEKNIIEFNKSKIISCVEISNTYRQAKAIELIKEIEPFGTKNLSLSEDFKKTFINIWFDKEWLANTNIIFKLLAIIIRLIYIPFFFLVFIIKKVTSGHRIKKFNKVTDIKIKNIQNKLILDYSIENYVDLISFWNAKGLSSNNSEYSFSENSMIECILKWYGILKSDDEAERISEEITFNQQKIYKNSYANGIKGLQMESISSQLLQEINFKFS